MSKMVYIQIHSFNVSAGVTADVENKSQDYLFFYVTLNNCKMIYQYFKCLGTVPCITFSVLMDHNYNNLELDGNPSGEEWEYWNKTNTDQKWNVFLRKHYCHSENATRKTNAKLLHIQMMQHATTGHMGACLESTRVHCAISPIFKQKSMHLQGSHASPEMHFSSYNISPLANIGFISTARLQVAWYAWDGFNRKQQITFVPIISCEVNKRCSGKLACWPERMWWESAEV